MAGKPRITIDYNKIYESNSCGPFKIIEDMGRDEKSRFYVKIKFLHTGTEKVVRYDIAINGKVIDELYGIDFNKIYYSIYNGPFKIIKYLGRNSESKKLVRIKFLNTGFESNVLLRCANDGTVKDYTLNYNQLQLSSHNIDQYDNFIIKILKMRWNAMMSRCYNINNSSYNAYGKIGVKVCEYWHNMENYILSMPYIFNFFKFYNNPKKYFLDKDYKQLNIPKSKRIYSPETCIFLSNVDNSNLEMKEKIKPNEYYGIRKTNDGNYKVTFAIDGIRYNFGVYNNLEVALSEYNYYYLLYSNYEMIPLLNENIKSIDHEEAKKYLISK